MKKEKIKVLHNFPIWLPQTHTWMFNQVIYTNSEKIENHIVCERTENLDQFNVPNIHSLSEAPRSYYHWEKGLKKLHLRRHFGFAVRVASQVNADILHSHFGDNGWRNIGAAKKGNLKHITTFYGYDVNMLPQQDAHWLKRYGSLFENVEAVLCEGSFMAKSIVGMGCPENKVIVNHLGIDVDRIAFKPRHWQPGEALKVLIAASFREKKGIPFAIKALGILKEKVPLEITIIGDAGPGPHFQREKKIIIDAIEDNALQSEVRMLGYQPHSVLLHEAYRHHVFLSPSVTASDGDTEGGAPVTIIEMAASGMLVVSTKHCDIPEVINHGDMGLLADERDVDGLVENLNWLVENPGRWMDMQNNARAHIEKEYDARVQGGKLADIYCHIGDCQRTDMKVH